MTSVKKRVSKCLHLEQKNLNEISLEDIEFMEVEEQKVNQEVAQLLSLSNLGQNCGKKNIPQSDSIPCKSFWVENTKDLILYVWSGDQSKTIIVPQSGWTIRDDITVH
jgi:hypothetical protein